MLSSLCSVVAVCSHCDTLKRKTKNTAIECFCVCCQVWQKKSLYSFRITPSLPRLLSLRQGRQPAKLVLQTLLTDLGNTDDPVRPVKCVHRSNTCGVIIKTLSCSKEIRKKRNLLHWRHYTARSSIKLELFIFPPPSFSLPLAWGHIKKNKSHCHFNYLIIPYLFFLYAFCYCCIL